MSRKIRQQIEDIANYVRNEMYPKTVHNSLDLGKRVKNNFGIDILYTDYDQTEGYLRWNKFKNVPQIVLSRKNNYRPKLQVYIIAHELGHLFLHWKWYPTKIIQLDSKNYVLNSDSKQLLFQSDNEQEKEANQFANDLLMPKSAMKQVCKGLNMENVNSAKLDIATEFGVLPFIAYNRLLSIYAKVSVK